MKPTWLRKFWLAMLGVLGALLLLEVGARAAIYTGITLLLPPEVAQWIGTQQVVFDAELGWRPAAGLPKVVGEQFPQESFSLMRRPRVVGELRGFALGDSQTHGAGVAEGAAWPMVVETDLRGRGLNIRVINLGSSGYRSPQVLRLLETYVLPQSPDFLIVDCMIKDGEALPRDYSQHWGNTRRVLFESRIYRLLWLGVTWAKGQNLGAVESVVIEQPATGLDGEGSHKEIYALARAADIPILFVDYPFIAYPVRAMAPAEGLPVGASVVAATAMLNRSGYQPYELFLDANHLSVLGNQLVGQMVAADLEKILKFP